MKTLADARDRAELVRRLRTLRPDSPRRWGRMSPGQMVRHLADSFLACAGQLPVSTDLSLLNRTLLKWAALYMPTPWPHGFPTRPELNQVLGAGTKPGELANDVAEVEGLMEALAASEERLFHPIFGGMRRDESMRWAWRHVDHHLRQFGA